MRALLVALPLVLVAGSALAAEKTILPGYWESVSEANLMGRSTPKTERRCITADKVAQFISTPSTGHYTCTYAKKSVSGGKADFQGQCVDKHGNAFDIVMQGTYAAEHFHMAARFSLPNLPMFGGTASTDAKRISAECPVEEPR